jgi:hypothetical protein
LRALVSLFIVVVGVVVPAVGDAVIVTMDTEFDEDIGVVVVFNCATICVCSYRSEFRA